MARCFAVLSLIAAVVHTVDCVVENQAGFARQHQPPVSAGMTARRNGRCQCTCGRGEGGLGIRLGASCFDGEGQAAAMMRAKLGTRLRGGAGFDDAGGYGEESGDRGVGWEGKSNEDKEAVTDDLLRSPSTLPFLHVASPLMLPDEQAP